MALIRILREQDLVAGRPGDEREVSAQVARELVDRGDAERVIVRSVNIERTEEGRR